MEGKEEERWIGKNSFKLQCGSEKTSADPVSMIQRKSDINEIMDRSIPDFAPPHKTNSSCSWPTYHCENPTMMKIMVSLTKHA